MDQLVRDAEDLKKQVERKKSIILLQRIERQLPSDYLALESRLFEKLSEIDELNQLVSEEQKVNIVKKFGLWGDKYQIHKDEIFSRKSCLGMKK